MDDLTYPEVISRAIQDLMQKSPSDIRDLLELNSSSLRRASDRICQQAIESQQIRPEDLQFQVNAVRSGMAKTTVQYTSEEFMALLQEQVYGGRSVSIQFGFVTDLPGLGSPTIGQFTLRYVSVTVDGEGVGLSRKVDEQSLELTPEIEGELVTPRPGGIVRVDFGHGLVAVPFAVVTTNGIPMAKLNSYTKPYRGWWALLGANNRAIDGENSQPYLYRSLAEVREDVAKILSQAEYSTCGGVVTISPSV